MKMMTKFGLLPVVAVATVAAGTLMGAGSAEAAGLTPGSSLTIGGNLEEAVGTTPGLIDFADSFFGDGIDDGIVLGGTGDFTALIPSFVSIQDLTFDAGGSLSVATNPFIDFGNVDFGAGLQSFTFELISGLLDLPAGPSSNATFVGNFLYGGQYAGSGHLGFSSAGNANGYTVSLTVADVPEPATMLGLGLVAGAGFLASRRKQAEA
jgi:hypothetical protein